MLGARGYVSVGFIFLDAETALAIGGLATSPGRPSPLRSGWGARRRCGS